MPKIESSKGSRILSDVRMAFGLAALSVLLAACQSDSALTRSAPATNVLTPAQIEQLIASPDRSSADRSTDQRRKPDLMLSFIGVRRGMIVLDVSASAGYTTELLSRAVGPSGRVYAQNAPRDPNRAPAAPEGRDHPESAVLTPAPSGPVRVPGQALVARINDHGLTNVTPVIRPFEDPVPPEVVASGLDMVTLMFNYHDLGHLDVNRARMNSALFAALKPGGLYIIADHAGRDATGISESGTLHRIEEAFLKQEVLAAGFQLVDEAFFLHNPADPRNRNTPDPPQPKDEFVLKFQKPR